MNKSFLITIFIGVFIATFLLSGDNSGENKNFKFSQVQIGESVIDLEIVEAPEERAKGLSGRNSLPDDSGMLFLFPKRDLHGIWMKGMEFSIDILWLDENFEVVHIKREAHPESFPEVFKPETKSLYVLEINSGLTEKEGIEVRETLEFF